VPADARWTMYVIFYTQQNITSWYLYIYSNHALFRRSPIIYNIMDIFAIIIYVYTKITVYKGKKRTSSLLKGLFFFFSSSSSSRNLNIILTPIRVRVYRSGVCTETRAAANCISQRRRVCVRFRANRERRRV